MKLGEKLKELRKEKRYSLRKLAEIIGVSHTYIADVEKGNIDARNENIEKLIDTLCDTQEEKEKVYRIRDWEKTPNAIKERYSYLEHRDGSAHYLQKGDGEKRKNLVLLVNVYDKVTIYGNQVVGDNFIKHHPYIPEKHWYELKDNKIQDEDNHSFFAIIQNDNSMEGEIKKGDIVCVLEHKYPENNEIGLFSVDGKILVRRIKVYGDISILKADNPKYDEIIVHQVKKFKALGKVMTITRQYK